MYSARTRKRVTNNRNIAKVPSLLTQISPDVCYDHWMRVLMAIYYETDGSEDGFELADDWSSKGDKYLGTKDVRSTWNCFKPNHPNPVRIGTLIRMAKQGS